MIIIKEALFEDRLAVITIDLKFIHLDFDGPFKKFKEGDGISKPYLNHQELSYIKKELGIKRLPFEIYSSDVLEKAYDLVRK